MHTSTYKEFGVKFQLAFRTPSGYETTAMQMFFKNGQSIINLGDEYYVHASSTVAHGDAKTQAVRKEFMGMEKNDVGRLVCIFDNMEGRWCMVLKPDGTITDCSPHELNLVSKEIYDQWVQIYDARTLLKDAKPALYTYQIEYQGLPKTIQSDTPIVRGTLLRFEENNEVRYYFVESVNHLQTIVDGISMHCGTQLRLEAR